MLVKVHGSAVFGINATIVTAEVNVENGAFFFLVGLPDSAVKESQQRMDAALRNNGLYFPRGKGVTINLAPADIRKEGTAYDLPLAVGLLAATEQVPADLLATHLIMGELSLDGGVRPIKGALPIAIEAKKQGFKGIILPAGNAREAAIVEALGTPRAHVAAQARFPVDPGEHGRRRSGGGGGRGGGLHSCHLDDRGGRGGGDYGGGDDF